MTAGTTEDVELQPTARRMSITSQMSTSRHAVLPHGISLANWTEKDKAELDDHVRHMLHSKREGFMRSMRGFRQYLSKPLGLFVTVYAVLVTVFGAAWVFFLIGWIYVGEEQDYTIHIVDNILVALFALVGDGLAPFRAVDTYHMCFIARYAFMTWRIRKEKALPQLTDHNDLPYQQVTDVDLERLRDQRETNELSVLRANQQKRLQYHQAKFSKTHTFYRPHETPTHHAFPLRLLIAVVVLLDFHSFFQIALGTITWSIPAHSRPESITTIILTFSLCCNIAAGIVISIGDRRTRKKDVLERMFRQRLTTDALGRMRKTHQNERLAVRIDRELQKKQQHDAENAPAPPEHAAVPALLQPAGHSGAAVLPRRHDSAPPRNASGVSREASESPPASGELRRAGDDDVTPDRPSLETGPQPKSLEGRRKSREWTRKSWELRRKSRDRRRKSRDGPGQEVELYEGV